MKAISPFEGLRLPVFAAPMFLVSGVDLVIAACKSGIVGSFPTSNARPIEQLDSWMAQISNSLQEFRDENPDKPVGPWCANVITHSSNSRLASDLSLLEKYRPPVVVTALGSPKPVLDLVHGYGGIVIADVINMKLAHKAVDAGADGLACISAGAGGHTGYLSPFAFVRAVKQFFDGYVVIGGGITDGYGIAGSLAAGADLVYMGTRFIPTHESLAAHSYKEMIVRSTVDDLVISDRITGTPASWLKPSLERNGIELESLEHAPVRNYDSSQQLDTRRWKSIWAAGQGLDSIHRVEPVAEVVDRLEIEFFNACNDMQEKTDKFRAPGV